MWRDILSPGAHRLVFVGDMDAQLRQTKKEIVINTVAIFLYTEGDKDGNPDKATAREEIRAGGEEMHFVALAKAMMAQNQYRMLVAEIIWIMY